MAYKFQLGSAILSGSTKFEELVEAAGGFKPTVADTAAAVADDSFYFQDSDGAMKRESMADYATAIAGDGLAASSGVLSVGVDDSSIETNSDALRIKDSGVTAAKLNTDVISAQAELAHADIADADELMISDGGVLKKTGVDSLRDHFFGVVSGDAAIADGGALTIAANAVQTGMVHDDVATELAGVGLSAASGVMAVDLNELTAAELASGDFLAFVDSDGSNATKKESVDDLATLFAGAGLGASSAVLSVQVSGALKITSDKVGISGSFAGIGLSFDGGGDYIDGIDLDLNELTAGAIADGDFLAFVDANDSNVTKKEAVADLATLFAGNGLVAASSVLAVNPGAGLEINSDAVRAKVASNGGLTRAAGVGNDELAMNMNGLDAAAVAVGADSIAIVDADDSNKTKKESIADLMAAVAGTGLSAASGVLNAHLDVALKADTETLAVGLNYMADMSADGEDTLNLPASSGLTVGDIIHVKAPSDCSSARTVKILKNGSQTIDGLTQVIIESPFGAVSMVYVAADTFRLI